MDKKNCGDCLGITMPDMPCPFATPECADIASKGAKEYKKKVEKKVKKKAKKK